MNLDDDGRKNDSNPFLKNPYENSSILKKLLKATALRNSPKIAFFDIDITLTNDIKTKEKIRSRLEELNYSLVFVTSRTEEMVMSKKQYEKSVSLGFTRPKPYIKKEGNGKYIYKDPAKIDPTLIDPDIIIGSTGTQIMIRQQQGGYMEDASFTHEFHIEHNLWRKKVFDIIKIIDENHSLGHIAPIDSVENYENRKTDVYPPYFRIKILFDSLAAKVTFLMLLKTITPITTGITHQLKDPESWLRIIDDSNPGKNSYAIYLTPLSGYKGNAVNHVVQSICSASQNIIMRHDINVILAGDSYPDIAMLLYGASGTNATSILVGGSTLSKLFIDTSIDSFCGEDLSDMKQQLSLHGEKLGHYQFSENKNLALRSIIVGDKAYPQTKGAQTILAYLDQEDL